MRYLARCLGEHLRNGTLVNLDGPLDRYLTRLKWLGFGLPPGKAQAHVFAGLLLVCSHFYALSGSDARAMLRICRSTSQLR